MQYLKREILNIRLRYAKSLQISLLIIIALFLGMIVKKMYSPNLQAPQPSPSQCFETIRQKTLNLLNNSSIVSSTLTYNYKGEIVEIERAKGIATEHSNIEYDVILRIKGKGEVTNEFFLNDDLLSHIKIIDVSNGKKTQIKFNQLKVSDKINMRMIWVYNPSAKGYNKLQEGEITKL